MIIEIKVPVLAESVPDATLLEWQKNIGEFVERGEILIDLETDKVTLEVASPEAGIVKDILKKSGDVVLTDDILAVIDTEGARTTANTAEASNTQNIADNSNDENKRLGPAARKLIAENNIAISSLTGTGNKGRITKADVLNYLETNKQAPEKDVTSVTPTVEIRPISKDQSRIEERVPMTRLRKKTAERLLIAQSENALLSTFNEVDMKPIMNLRSRFKEEFEERYGVRLGFMSFFVKAAVEALKKFPIVNAAVDGDDIIYHGFFDIGVAVGSERGLVVPIMRDVENMSLADIERRIRDFGERARDGKLTIDELTGGTFTISNGGVYGSLLSTPIINTPQSAILGMHKIQDRPMVENGEIVIKSMMYLALTYDHRIIDGRDAVQFLDTIRRTLEEPSRLLLAI
ncbi:MAG: 2-oxoglutarate dehydrogenase complex dihydrolipoyllysine-residue succinyltransferase [Gammaproteobacteria bacterium]